MMVPSSTTQTQPSSECCMCGDFGLSFELFRCRICQFRSQHRYCSNQYPKAESYRVCNWCLSYEKDGDSAMEKNQNSSDSSSSCRANTGQIDDQTNPNKKKIANCDGRSLRDRIRRSSSNLHIPVRKQRSPEQQSLAGRKRILTIGVAMEESSSNGGKVMMRRSKSDHEILLSNIGGGGGHGIKTKQVYRNKVRRYKLLDEVSSQ